MWRRWRRCTHAADAPSVDAGELLLGAGGGHLGAAGVSLVLVCTVHTVGVAVTDPPSRDARRAAPLAILSTEELVLGALPVICRGEGRAGLIVWPIVCDMAGMKWSLKALELFY